MKKLTQRYVLLLLFLFICGGSLFAMRPKGDVGCTGTYYVFFTELDLPCNGIDEEGMYFEGRLIACNAALFNNCNYNSCCQ